MTAFAIGHLRIVIPPAGEAEGRFFMHDPFGNRIEFIDVRGRA